MSPKRVAVAVLVVLCTACTGEDRTLTVAMALLPGELAAYREVVSSFERTSGWRVVIVPQQYPDIRRALAAEAAAGEGTLDLVELDVYSLAPAAGQVRRLDDLGDVTGALEPGAVRAGAIDGLRFLPHRVSWQALVYDHEVLGRPPATWEEVLAVARAHPGRIGIKGASYEGLTCDLLPWVWSAGGSGADLDDEGARAAFAFLAQLAPYLDARSEVFKEATIAEAMARGELVLHLNWPFVMSLYEAEGLAPGRLRAAPLPLGPRGRATVLGGGYLAVPRYAPHPHAAVALIRFLLSQATQQRLARSLGWFSARRDVGVGGDPALLGGWAAMRGEVRPRPERVDYPQISRQWQRAFRRVAFEGVSPEQALREGQRALSGQRAPSAERAGGSP